MIVYSKYLAKYLALRWNSMSFLNESVTEWVKWTLTSEDLVPLFIKNTYFLPSDPYWILGTSLTKSMIMMRATNRTKSLAPTWEGLCGHFPPAKMSSEEGVLDRGGLWCPSITSLKKPICLNCQHKTPNFLCLEPGSSGDLGLKRLGAPRSNSQVLLRLAWCSLCTPFPALWLY